MAGASAATAVLQSHRQLPAQSREHLRVLPASANWYCSKICDWGYSDALGLLLAFGAKDRIFIYQVALEDSVESALSSSKPPHNPTGDSNSSLRFFAHLKRGKKDQRVTALQFLNELNGGELRLLCGGEEGGVQIWDVATLKLVEQHRKHGSTEVMAVTASTSLDPAFVVAGDRQGRISVWKRDEETVTVFTPITGDGVFAMAMAPHDKALVAVGYRSGVLCIIDALQGNVRYRLDGHDQEVQSVVWKAVVPLQIDNSNSNGGAWLASSSRDRSIKVWRVSREQEPELVQVLTLPKGKQASSYNQSKRLWLPIAWSYENDSMAKLRLWSGSFDGNLFAWEWTPTTAKNAGDGSKKPKLPACKPMVVKNGHSRLLFNIVSLPPSISIPPAKLANAPSMLSVSLDRELRIWKEGSTSAALVCQDKFLGLGGHVYSVAYNASSQVIACGVGDQTIRLWNVSPKSSLKSLYQADLLWKGLQSKVTCVAWHPFQRSLLGYGTEDGQLGIFDTETKKTVRFKSYHGSQVAVLQWRARHSQPQAQEDQEAGDTSAFVQAMIALESAQAEGQSLEDALKTQDLSPKKDPNELLVLLWSQDQQKTQIFESNPDKPDLASLEIKLQATCTSFAWSARGDRLAVGRENGAVEVFAVANGSEFVSILKLHENEQKVVSLAWSSSSSSSAAAADETVLLAAGSQDGKIIVFDLTPSEQKKTIRKKIIASLNEHVVGVFTGHSNAITSLRWNATESKIGGDGDIEIGGDGGHPATLLLASSSTDGTIQVWDLEKQTRLSCFRHHTGRVLSVDWISQFVLVSGGDDQTVRMWDYRDQREEDKTLTKTSKPQPQQQQNAADKATKITINQNGHGAELHATKSNVAEREIANSSGSVKKAVKAKKKKVQSVLFHSDTPVALEESLRLCTANLQEQPPPANTVERFIVEERAYAAEQDWEQLAQVLLLQGKIGDALRLVAKEGVLNASWLAFAPMAGVDVWREVTNVYAHQLDAQGDKKTAALHFLSLGKTRCAIKSLTGGHLFSEALALISSRLGSQDPLFSQTLLDYAALLEKRERFGEAAQTLLKIGTAVTASRAVLLLVKTGDTRAFETALEICASLKHVTSDSATDAQDGDCSIPNRVFLEIISKALSTRQFSLAERAGRWLGTGAIGSPSSSLELSVSTRLTRCFLGIVNEFTRQKNLSSSVENGPFFEDVIAEELQPIWTTSIFPNEMQELFIFLMQHHKHSYSASLLSRMGGGDSTKLQSRSERSWHAMLSLCEKNGFWFGSSHEEHVLEAQELLMDKSLFTYLLGPAVSSTEATDETLKAIMGMSHCLLQFLLDVVSGYLLSGLERIRDAFEIFSSGDSSGDGDPSLVGMEFELATLFFPSGFVDPETPPDIGELAIEAHDTAAFWRSFLLFQCRTALSIAKAESGGLGTDSSSLLANVVGEELAMRLISRDDDLESEEFNLKLFEQLRTILSTFLPTESTEMTVSVSADRLDTEETRVE